MSTITANQYLDKVYQWLLIGAFFSLPISVALNKLFIGILVLLWVFSGNYIQKFNIIIANKLAIASVIFYLLHIVGMLWTSDIDWGANILKKMLDFLLILPILLTITKKENIKYYISAFLIAMSIVEITSYLIWFEIIAPFGNATAFNPTPTMSHISYNPFLAFAAYVVLYKLFFNTNTKVVQLIYCIFFLTMSVNMFITAGRAGQVMYLIALIIFLFQYFNTKKIKAIILSILIVPFIFFTAYNLSEIFEQRVNMAVTNISHYEDNKHTSVGLRITHILHSLKIIKDNPIFGVGTGDFKQTYEDINYQFTPELPSTHQPHNMYLLVYTQLGILGLISLLSLFYFQISMAKKSQDILIKNIGIVLPLLFLVIMFSDSYLLGHYTTSLFILFSAFLYKPEFTS